MKMRIKTGTVLVVLMVITFLSYIPSGWTASFAQVTTGYAVSGQICYVEGGFINSYMVRGEMKIILTVQTASNIKYEESYYLRNDEGALLEQESRAGVFANRIDEAGNYTLTFVEMPIKEVQYLSTLTESVPAQYLGVRYLDMEGQWVQSQYYCYVVTSGQTVLRDEWWFDANTGTLLRFLKSIEMNFVRVQWVDYYVKNTTLSLEGVHPVTAFLGNVQETFFAVIGAVCVGIVLFYLLVQQKAGKGGAIGV